MLAAAADLTPAPLPAATQARETPTSITSPAPQPSTGTILGPWIRRAVTLDSDVRSTGAATTQEYPQHLDNHADELAARIDAAQTRHAELEARVRLFWWHLSRQIDPALSGVFYGIDDEGERNRIDELTALAVGQLAAIEVLLDGLVTEPTTQPADVQRWHAELPVMRPWPEALRAAATGTPQQCTAAAEGLAELAQCLHPPIQEPARFWAAMLWLRAGQPDRAVEVLDMALVPPQGHAYEILPKLLRCRALAQAGKLTAASALLVRMQNRLADWFDEQVASLVAPAIILERLAVMDLLADRLIQSDYHAQAAEVLARGCELRNEFFGPGTVQPLPRLDALLPGPIVRETPPPASRAATTSQHALEQSEE
jgi:hypothetical protein